MISDKLIFSTAYFPPVKYISLLAGKPEIVIEREENYIKQTFRNRCCILSANGIQNLTVPVLEGTFHKRLVKDIKIDYSKRWQKVHLRSIKASYSSSPYYDFYYGAFDKVINGNHKFLLDLNYESLATLLTLMKIETRIDYSSVFISSEKDDNDFRYKIIPKKSPESLETGYNYIQVFSDRYGFVDGLSGLDLIFNTGPDSRNYLISKSVYGEK